MGSSSLLQGDFPTQGSSPCVLCLLYWQADSFPLSHLGSPKLQDQVEMPGTEPGALHMGSMLSAAEVHPLELGGLRKAQVSTPQEPASGVSQNIKFLCF